MQQNDLKYLEGICSNIEASLAVMADTIRRHLASANIGEMRLDIEVQGRTATGNLLIEFCLGAGSYAAGNISGARGGRLMPVVIEMLHRHDWRLRNVPLCLPAGETLVTQEGSGDGNAE